MNGGRRTRAATASEAVGKETLPVVKEESAEEPMVVLDESHLESEVAKLRGRWELASVLNFLSVFEPVIGSGLKLSAEEIEMALIKPNSLLAKLHILLLKGIPPVSKNLNGSDAWVTVLCKKLDTWWPWVAEGEIPLVAAKGEEIPRYKQLDSTNRLLILKALCELRAHQDDTVSYVNDALKEGNQISSFRKDKIGGDGNGTSYWYDGNKTIGYRLYRELNIYPSKRNSKGKGCLTPPAISSQWETLATNLDEFRKVVDELSGSKVVAEVDVSKTIETDAIPVLEKLQKNKDRALETKATARNAPKLILRSLLRLELLALVALVGLPLDIPADGSYHIYCDRAALLSDCELETLSQWVVGGGDVGKGKTTDERKGSQYGRNGIASNVGQEMDTDSQETDTDSHETDTDSKDSFGKKGDSQETDTDSSFGKKGDSMDNDTANDMLQEVGIDDENDNDDYCGKKDDDIDDGSDLGNSEADRNHATLDSQKPSNFTSHPVVETRSLGAKNRLRQRPTHNSALDSLVVPDSDDENLPENTNKEISGDQSSSPGTDAEEVRDS
uniref:DDT domain-containing protein n=1 Tax=Fagus sylvatica TaxID=28930 RepID=A0A2N9EF26_FAGSY